QPIIQNQTGGGAPQPRDDQPDPGIKLFRDIDQVALPPKNESGQILERKKISQISQAANHADHTGQDQMKCLLGKPEPIAQPQQFLPVLLDETA
ncbi:MAG: hypothetical protein HYZ36_03990, partial [Pedosphaera parvula]|nr:hypothetical protein [Pedosphaera parvula]